MRLRRRHILAYVIFISIVCLIVVSRTYDKYSRNQSINDSNRAIIERYLNEEDKKYLIDNNVDVNLFLPFIKEKGFKLENYEYYDIIYQYNKDLKKAEIVKKGNELVDQEFTLNSLNNIFKNNLYSLDQLIELSSTKSSYYPESVPEFYPNNLLTLSDEKHYIADYKPADLVLVNKQYTLKERNIYLKEEANTQLNLMCKNLTLLTDKPCGGLKIREGYSSYDNTLKNLKKKPTFIKPGHNEFQLGYTISFNKSTTFNRNDLYLWLLDNSYKYGFIQRYPEDKQDITKVSNEYGTFRYVGMDNAKELVTNNKTIEEKRGE